MIIDPWAVMPVHMQRLVRESEARDANEAELAELARQDEAASRAIMARHAENVHIAMTGHTSSEWMAAQQQRATALAEAGYDPSAPLGSPQHPETLIDGGSLTPNSAQAAVAEVTRYATTSGMDAQLARCRDEADAWNSPAIRRQRELSLRGQLARESAAGPGRVITRAAASVPAPPPSWKRDPRLPHQSLPGARLPAGDW
jgi:hypothetical protein